MSGRVIRPFKLRIKVVEVVRDGVKHQCAAMSFQMNRETGMGLAWLLSDGLTFQQPMHVDAWNKLPFCTFETNGHEAPRPPKHVLPGDPPPPASKN